MEVSAPLDSTGQPVVPGRTYRLEPELTMRAHSDIPTTHEEMIFNPPTFTFRSGKCTAINGHTVFLTGTAKEDGKAYKFGLIPGPDTSQLAPV